MAYKSKIEWTDATWNPIRGCSRVSEGCRNCYAEAVANRFCGPGKPYEGLVQVAADGKGLGKWNGQIKFVEMRLLDPLHWKQPRRIFVNSMSDLFHENVTDEMLDRIFAVMALSPQHTFQVLTKRPDRMLAYLSASDVEARVARACVHNGQPLAPGYFSMTPGGGDLWEIFGGKGKFRFVDERVNGGVPCSQTTWAAADFNKWPLPNVWLGVSVESQDVLNKRAWVLLKTPAAVRFLSCEPLLGPLDLNDGELIFETWRRGPTIGTYLDWVICGGESGHRARPMHPDWARSLRDQCVAAGVPFFFKQWGEWQDGSSYPHKELTLYPDGRTCEFTREAILEEERRSGKLHCDGRIVLRVGKKAAGDLLDGVQWHQFPAVGVTA